jgi:dienelactone hydrolase
MRLTLPVAAVLLTVAMSVQAGSARMELEIGPGLFAEADYWPGEVDRPAVLILHGFLSTRHFSTVRRLAEGLADEGYSVLTPSLSLGFNRRKQSIACEAIHTHSMDQDIAELKAWTEWLNRRAGKPPVVIGHSAGGVQLAAMLDAYPKLAIDRAILISLSYFGEELGARRMALLKSRALQDHRSRPNAMLPYSLTYCSTYVTTAGNLLSYLAWDKQRLQAALLDSPVSLSVIYGGGDERIDRNWIGALQNGGVPIRAVPDANHFFDLAHEFDLLDEVIKAVSGVAHG